jgi:hypothetical protein
MVKDFFNGQEADDATEGVAALARLFPGAVPVRIPVCVSKANAASTELAEQTVIEFGTAEEILFVTTLSLDFDDTVRVCNADGSLNTVAKVIAMRLHHGRMAIAARFLQGVANWIIKD